MSFLVDFGSIHTAYAWGLLLLGAAVLAIVGTHTGNFVKTASRPLQSAANRRVSTVSDKGLEDAYYNIEPLSDFDLESEEPIQARPFKPKYHMTMAIENTTFSDLIAMDKTYRERIQIRRSLIKNEHDEVIGSNAKADKAVFELYAWLTTTYLPKRFPTMFTPTASGLLNHTTQEVLPPTPDSATHALEILGSHTDNEFLILLPSADPSDGGKYRLEAFLTCFPSGFRTRSKLGLLLSSIHSPVPHYAQKLERSMDRFFAVLPAGKMVKRWNWTISTSGELFCVKGNHATREELELEGKEGKGSTEHVNLRTTYLRCERQTLHRLPSSKAVVFAFKTYQYPISELRGDGSGEALCEAIDGMGTGSAPQMVVYKRQVVWGKKIKAFLRGEIGVDE